MHERRRDDSSWRSAIWELASYERPSASDGERRAAESIAARLRELGLEADLEEERAHGGYWWPLALANLLAVGGAVAARRGGIRARLLGAVAGALGAAAVWDEVSGGSMWFRRALMPHRSTWNVVARAGDPEGPQTVVLIAHHDAAHSGLIFHPALARIAPRVTPRMHARSSHTVPVLYAVWLGPALVCAAALGGARRPLGAGAALAAGATAALVNIGASAVVPGANDNLSAVGALLAVAEELARDPLEGVHVVLVSTGSEESFMEGMRGFARRHFDEFDPARTEMVCLECLGGPTLVVLEGEGMLRMRDYPAEIRDELAGAAKAAGVEISRGLRTVASTDALIALGAGFRVGTLASVDYTKFPLNYHWPTDTPDALHWGTIEDAIAVCTQFLRARAVGDRLSGGVNA
jgi:Peptidase family M28